MSTTRQLALRSAHTIVQSSAQTGRLNYTQLKSAIQRPNYAGQSIILIFGLAFCIWGFFVPLEGGAMAPGVFSPDSSKKTVQHLEGGIVSELLVQDGDTVRAGQPLMVLDDIQARAMHDSLEEQRLSLLAKQARLRAESFGEDQVKWPADLLSSNTKVQSIRDAQQQVFETRRTAFTTKKDVLRQRIEQLNEQIKGYQAQVDSAVHQINFIDEEIQAKGELLGKGLISRPEYLSRKRMEAELSGRRGEYAAQIAGAQQSIGEAQMQLLAADAERADQIANDSDKTRTELTDITEKLRANDDVLKRTVITAPVAGAVMNLKFKTIGGVVQRGETIMEIVPSNDALIIEARITPIDVKAVHKGLPAKIHLAAYSYRSTPRVPGTVMSVSADRLMDETTHQPYYLARVSVDRHVLHDLAPDVRLIPGMPADVLIVTGQHTMFEYLIKPFRDSFRQSFHEM